MTQQLILVELHMTLIYYTQETNKTTGMHDKYNNNNDDDNNSSHTYSTSPPPSTADSRA